MVRVAASVRQVSSVWVDNEVETKTNKAVMLTSVGGAHAHNGRGGAWT